MLKGINADLHRSALSFFRQTDWEDVAELAELFTSENLKTPHGKYFDQRFVDFLSHNFASIDNINWRKFEGLTCEFFHQIGLHVEIGSGRDDGSIDARVWPRPEEAEGPPLIVVQCKRQKQKVAGVFLGE